MYNVLKKPISDGAEAVDQRGVSDQLDSPYNVLYRGPSSVVNRHLTPLGAFEQRKYINLVEPSHTEHTDDKPGYGPDKTISTTPINEEESVYSLIKDINPGNYQGATQDSVYNVLKKPLSGGAEAVDRRGVSDQLDPLYNVLYRGPSSVVNRHLIPLGAFEQRKYINLVEPSRTEHTDDGPDKTIPTTPINVDESVHRLIEDIDPGNYRGEAQDSVYNVLKKPISDGAEAVDRHGVSDQLDPLYNVLHRDPSSVLNRNLTPLGAFEQRKYINLVEPSRTEHTDDKPGYGPDKTISTTPINVEESVHRLIKDINPGNYQGEAQDSVYNVLKKPLSDGAEAVDRRGVSDQLHPLYNVLHRDPSSVGNRHL